MPKHTPLLDRVLVKRDPAPQLHPTSGLAMSFEEQKNHQPFTGEVVAVGPGQHVSGVFCPTSHLLQPGRRVLFAPMGGTTVDHDGAEHLLMREADILSVLDK